MNNLDGNYSKGQCEFTIGISEITVAPIYTLCMHILPNDVGVGSLNGKPMGQSVKTTGNTAEQYMSS